MVDTLIHWNFQNFQKVIKAEIDEHTQLDELLKQILYVKE